MSECPRTQDREFCSQRHTNLKKCQQANAKSKKDSKPTITCARTTTIVFQRGGHNTRSPFTFSIADSVTPQRFR